MSAAPGWPSCGARADRLGREISGGGRAASLGLRPRRGLPPPAAARATARAAASTSAPGRRAPTRRPTSGDAGEPPVLLIHGYLATRGSLHLLERRLTRARPRVMSYPLGRRYQPRRHPRLGRPHRAQGRVDRRADRRRAGRHRRPLDGRAGRPYYVKRLGGRHRVRRLVMLGTPVAAGPGRRCSGSSPPRSGCASLQLLAGQPVPARAGRAAAARRRRGLTDRGGARLARPAGQHRAATGSSTSSVADRPFRPAGGRRGRRCRSSESCAPATVTQPELTAMHAT